jgi:pimeloyl-ACP methyl ester carboxylesterase
MLKLVKKLTYGARVLLSRSGELDMVDVAGRKIQMRHGGEGQPFVYLHSALGETIWLPYLEQWAQQFEVFAPAHPGFAMSQGFDLIADIEDMAFHYLELFDALGLEKVNLGGVSLGGWIAAEFAVRWPERVRRLWLANAPGLWLDDQPFFPLFRYAENADAIRNALFHDPASYQATMIIKDRKQLNEETLLSVYQSMTVLARLVWERPYDPKLARRLHRITCPTLILAGEGDRLVPPAYAEEYHRLIPGSRLHLFKECGHLPMFEKEAEFVDVVATFCREE